MTCRWTKMPWLAGWAKKV